MLRRIVQGLFSFLVFFRGGTAHDGIGVSSDAVRDLLVQLLQVGVDSGQVEQGERAQCNQEDISEEHLLVFPKHNEKDDSLDEDEKRADTGCERVVLEIDTHALNALSVPLKLSEFDDVLVVHLGWEQNRLGISNTKANSDEEQDEAETVSHSCESIT